MTSEAYLYYKQEVEKPTIQTCENQQQEIDKTSNEFFEIEQKEIGENTKKEEPMLRCVENIVYLITETSHQILRDGEGHMVLCSDDDIEMKIEGYELWKRL